VYLGTLSGVGFLVAWDLYVRLSGISPIFVPPPGAVAAATLRMLGTPEFLYDLQVSASEFAVGFGAALLVGIPLGLVTGWYRRAFYAMNPFLSSLYAMPRVSLLPWIILVAGIGFASKVLMVFLGVVLPLMVNVVYGVRTVNPALLSVARSYNASDLFIFRTIVFPSVIPFTLTGVRIGIGTGMVGLIIAEFLVAKAGVGHMMHISGHSLQIDNVFVGIIAIAVASLTMTGAVGRLERHFERWRPTGR